MTDAERLLWRFLCRRQLKGVRFRRQHPIGQYIADFACVGQKLLIELDGGQHQIRTEYDQQRTNYLQSQGWTVLRFWKNEVFENMEGVFLRISEALSQHPHPNPPPERGRGKTIIGKGRVKPTISLKARALRYLSAREHSRAELTKKLMRHVGEGDNLETLLDELEAAKFLSNERFAESLVNRRAARFGNSRIIHELREHGLGAEALADAKVKLAQDELTRAVEVWRRKFSTLPGSATERAKQMRFLQQRGFSYSAIQAAMRQLENAD